MMRRVPIDSAAPVVVFALSRLVVSIAALTAVAIVGFPYDGRAGAVLAVFVVWSILVLALARRKPQRALHPAVPAIDFALLLAIQLVAPDTLFGVQMAALFLIAAHAHFQGERRGVMIGALGAGALVAGAAIRGDAPVDTDLLIFYEVVFFLSALATSVVVGLLRTSESASRLRARELSRRTMQAESEVRRRVAESIHDGPVQELIGLDMILSAARGEADEEQVGNLIDEARDLVSRNVRALRDEIVELGPYAFQEMSFETAIENCMPVWQRRFGIEVRLAIEHLDLSPEMAGDLFRIAQEAVVNAGRHAEASRVEISLRAVGNHIELRVADDGKGFHGRNDLDRINGVSSEPGHLGLASMRERAELLDGELTIDSSDRGSRVMVLAPVKPVAV
ncbi:MAG TPA: ATP-binding protein [Thermoleophilaceae bacterium]